MATAWIKYLDSKPSLNQAVAITASPGLRSVGVLALEYLISKLNAKLFAELYSAHFPVMYETSPSYSTHPRVYGYIGVLIDSGSIKIPSVKFYLYDNIVLVKGYQANFHGQWEAAEETVNLLYDIGVKRIIALAAYGVEGDPVCIAAVREDLIKEFSSKYMLNVSYSGPLMGFTGLVLGEAYIKNMDALCLLSRTTPNPEDPEDPDPKSAQILTGKVLEILSLNIDLSDFIDIVSHKLSYNPY
ncbi:MAG: PAC2 family protein [Candidatus Methanomethylicia archaeon]